MKTARISRLKTGTDISTCTHIHTHTNLSALVSNEVVHDTILSQAQVPVQINRVDVMLQWQGGRTVNLKHMIQ